MARRVANAKDTDDSPQIRRGKLMLRNAPRTCVMTAPQKYRTSPLPAAGDWINQPRYAWCAVRGSLLEVGAGQRGTVAATGKGW